MLTALERIEKMARKRLLPITVLVLLLATASAQASSLSISIGRHGLHVSTSHRPSIGHHHRRPIHSYPRILVPHRPRVVVPRSRLHVHSPVYHPIARPCIKPCLVTVWITNSNGSKRSVILTKTPHGYKGPRGETYTAFPSNRQLRGVYGF